MDKQRPFFSWSFTTLGAAIILGALCCNREELKLFNAENVLLFADITYFACTLIFGTILIVMGSCFYSTNGLPKNRSYLVLLNGFGLALVSVYVNCIWRQLTFAIHLAEIAKTIAINAKRYREIAPSLDSLIQSSFQALFVQTFSENLLLYCAVASITSILILKLSEMRRLRDG